MRTGPAIRVVLVVAAVVVGATGVSRPAATALAALAVVAVLERVVRSRRRGPVDAVLVGAGALLVTTILLGLVLDAVPGGLSRVSWSVGLGLVGLAALAWSFRRPALPVAPVSRPTPATAIWLAVAGALAVTAIVVSVRSANDGEVQPIQLSVRGVARGHAQVVVRNGPASGSFELLSGTGPTQRVLRGPFTLAAGASLATTVAVPVSGRVRVELARLSPPASTRFVIVDTTGA